MNTQSAAQHAGVSEDQLRYWCKIDLVTSSVGGNGKGDRRWWTDRDVQCVILARMLLDDGAGTHLVREALELARPMPGWEDQLLVAGSEGVVVWPLGELDEARYWSLGVVLRMVNLGQIAAACRIAA